MKRIAKSVLPLVLALLGGQAMAASCEDVMKTIAAKIEANGVKAYTLDAVLPAEVGDRKVVGSCEGGSKKIVYTRK
jgi:hypothetical protein